MLGRPLIAAFLLAASPAAAMSGGRDTPIAQAPFVASIGSCTGSLIAPDRVLTAAHCVAGRDPRDLDVVVGADPVRDPDAPRVRATGISVAPGYRIAFPFSHRSPSSAIAVNDVALLMLAAPVEGVTPAVIGTASPGDEVELYGYGTTRPTRPPNPPPAPKPLRSGKLKVITRAACARAYPRAIRPTMVCAQDRARGPLTQPCAGDSGGPLVVRREGAVVQVGVTSWGAEVKDGDCGEKRLPAVWMRVSAFADLLTAPDPPIAPYPDGAVTVDGSLKAGATVTCAATFGGDPAHLRYRWATTRHNGPVFEDNARVLRRIRGATASTLEIPAAAVGKRLVCEVRAANAGGRAVAYSEPAAVR